MFRFIAAERACHSVKTLCRVLGVSRSGFHAWSSRPLSARALSDQLLLERVRQLHLASRRTYGSPRIYRDLRADGVAVGRKRVERLMRQDGLSGTVKRRRGQTTIRVPGVRVAEDLVKRDFRPPAPDQLWVADITYLRTWQGWLHLAVVVDCFSRRVVGWALEDNMRAELVVDALEQALQRRRPQRGLVHHSDQGSQYVSLAFGRRCRQAGIEQSGGRPPKRLRQRRLRIVLQDLEERPDRSPFLARQSGATHGRLRLHRVLLQPTAPPLKPRLPLTNRLRKNQPRRTSGLTIPCPPNRGNSSPRPTPSWACYLRAQSACLSPGHSGRSVANNLRSVG